MKRDSGWFWTSIIQHNQVHLFDNSSSNMITFISKINSHVWVNSTYFLWFYDILKFMTCILNFNYIQYYFYFIFILFLFLFYFGEKK
jgi:hypothetical protein